MSYFVAAKQFLSFSLAVTFEKHSVEGAAATTNELLPVLTFYFGIFPPYSYIYLYTTIYFYIYIEKHSAACRSNHKWVAPSSDLSLPTEENLSTIFDGGAKNKSLALREWENAIWKSNIDLQEIHNWGSVSCERGKQHWGDHTIGMASLAIGKGSSQHLHLLRLTRKFYILHFTSFHHIWWGKKMNN